MLSQIITAEDARVIQEASARMGNLLAWTIYDHPADFPTSFVLRPLSVQEGRVVPLAFHMLAETAEEARLMLPCPPGMVCFPREPKDAPCIFETWM